MSLTFAPVSTNAIISPLSLHARWSLKSWHQPIVPFPSVAIPLNTLLAYLLRLWHTGIIVESTTVILFPNWGIGYPIWAMWFTNF